MNYAKGRGSPACIAVENPIVRFDVDPVVRTIARLRTLLIPNILYSQSQTPNVFL
jgi:hypothetical protein